MFKTLTLEHLRNKLVVLEKQTQDQFYHIEN